MKSSTKGNSLGFLRKTEGFHTQGEFHTGLSSLRLNKQDIPINHLQIVAAKYILKNRAPSKQKKSANSSSILKTELLTNKQEKAELLIQIP